MGLSFLISQWSGSFSPAGLVDSTQIPREVGGLRVLGLLVRRQTMEQPSFQDKELYVDIPLLGQVKKCHLHMMVISHLKQPNKRTKMAA